MEQKIIATVGGHQITEAEVEAFIHSLPREQQVYAAHPDFRKQCEEQLIAVYAFAKYGEEEKIDETEEFKNVMENARKDILPFSEVAASCVGMAAVVRVDAILKRLLPMMSEVSA